MRRAFTLLFAGLILPIALLLILWGNGFSGPSPRFERALEAAPTPVSPGSRPIQTPVTAVPTPAASPNPGPLPEDLFTPDPAPRGGAGSFCGSRDTLLLLLVGSDSREDSYVYGLADVIRLVRVDFRSQQLAVLAIPRDLWVTIPGIAEHYGITQGKINQAYLYGGDGMGYYAGPGGGPGLLAATLQENYSVQVDAYLAVNMVTFARVVDALGGIDIVLPAAIDGRPARGGEEDQFFPAGEQHLDGEEALRLARLRNNYSDLDRSEHQDLILEALRARLFSPAVLPALPDLVEAFRSAILTNLKLSEVAELLCLAPQIQAENTIFAQIPPEMLELGREFSPQLNGRVSVLKADPEALTALLADFQAGTWPAEGD